MCTCMLEITMSKWKKGSKPTGVTYWPQWGKPIFPERFGVYILIMIILEVTSYWGMQWGKKSISLRNIGHQRYLVLDIGAVYGLLTLGCTRHGTKGREGGDGAPLGFLFCCNISKQFCLQWKAFDLLYNMRYIYGWWSWWRSVTSPNMVAILASILDFTKN